VAMTEIRTEEEASSTEISKEQGQKKEISRDVDWFLQMLVDLANSKAAEFPITLSIGGSLVSGMMIGGKEYFELQAKTIERNVPSDQMENAKPIVEGIQHLGEIYDDLYEDRIIGGDPSYIHLKKATVFIGDSVFPSHGSILWRGKIAAVDGFMLGAFTRS
jgi:hypothetical protein